MKKFIYQLFVFFLIILIYKLITFIPVLITLPGESNNYYGVNSNKPKIILVGSSNMDHNYDYKLLNKEFSKYNVIGCNLNEPSGLYATIHKLKKLNTKTQDIIIFCLPHSLYEEDKLFPIQSYKKSGFSYELLENFHSDFPYKFFKSIISTTVIDSYELIKKKKKFKEHLLKKNTFVEIPTVHSNINYINCIVGDENKFHIKSIPTNNKYLSEMLTFIKNSINGTIVFRYPSIKKNDYEINTERISFLKNNYPFINEFKSSIYEDQYWFNQWYHLNKCGKELNTKKLTIEINKYLKSKQSLGKIN